MRDKESFIDFINTLASVDKSNWENNNLDKYLKAMGDYTEDIDGFYKNLSNPAFDDLFKKTKESYPDVDMQDVFKNLPPIVWRVFADILMGSVSYE